MTTKKGPDLYIGQRPRPLDAGLDPAKPVGLRPSVAVFRPQGGFYMDDGEFQGFIDSYKQPRRRRLRRGEYPSPDDFDRMTKVQFETYLEAIGFARRVQDAKEEIA